MDEIPEFYNVQNIEQLRGIADSLRLRIFEALAQRAMTATQVGEELQIAAPKAHYHVRELERLGLVKLVETRERGGILEKYYRAIARNLIAPPQLLQTVEPAEVAAAITEVFTNLSQSFLTAMERFAAADETATRFIMPGMDGTTVWMTPDEFKQTQHAMMSLLDQYRKRRGIPQEREGRVTMVTFDAQLAEQDEQEERSAQPAPPEANAATPRTGGTPRRRAVRAVGALTYSRDDLERVAAAGEQLELDVVGYLSFSADVTPDLIERAIGHLRYRGMLGASSGVLEALKRKE